MSVKSIKHLTGRFFHGSGQRKYRKPLVQMVRPRLSSKHGFLSADFSAAVISKSWRSFFTPLSPTAFRASMCLCHCVQMCSQGRGSQTNLTRPHPHRSHICAAAQISLLPPTTTSICCRRRTPLCSNSPIVSRLAHLEPHPRITSAQNPDARLVPPPPPHPSRLIEPEGFYFVCLTKTV